MRLTLEALQRRICFLEDEVGRLARCLAANPNKTLTDRVVAEVAKEWGLHEHLIRSRCREREYADARHFVAYILRDVGRYTTVALAGELGRLDHNTARNSIRRATELMETYPRERARVLAVISRITAPETSTPKAPHA